MNEEKFELEYKIFILKLKLGKAEEINNDKEINELIKEIKELEIEQKLKAIEEDF